MAQSYDSLDGTQMRQSAVYATNELIRPAPPAVAVKALPADAGYEEIAAVRKPQGGSQAPAPPVRPSLIAAAELPPKVLLSNQYEVPQPVVGETVYASGRVEDSVRSNIDKEGADAIIRRAGFEDGAFVLRISRSHPGSFVLCVGTGHDVKHYPVELLGVPYEGMYSLLCPGVRHRFVDLADVLSFYTKTADGIATRLTRRLA